MGGAHRDGIRKEKVYKDPMAKSPWLSPPPKGWISAQDYWLNHQRDTQHLPAAQETSDTALQNDPSHMDVWLTVFDALDDVYSIFQQSSMLSKVQHLQHNNRQDVTLGLISNEEQQRRDVILNQIRDGYCASMDDIVSWYLDTFFRIFDAEG